MKTASRRSDDGATTSDGDYGLVDIGAGERLERFGDRLVRRPAPTADGPKVTPAAWRHADLRYERGRGWTGVDASARTTGGWVVSIRGVRLGLRPTDAGQLGCFPEHASMVRWLLGRGRGPVLNLFAATGLTTLAMADAGLAVTHLDASRTAVAWARENAGLNDLTDRPIRWIVDDALAFTAREARRERRYAGVVLDPPSFGHGAGGREWRLERDLPELLEAVSRVMEPDGFVLLTAHTTGVGPAELRSLVARMPPALARPGAIETGTLDLRTRDGRALPLGAFARVDGRHA